MDPKWLDRDKIDQEIKTVNSTDLTYNHDLGVYCLKGEPFTGVSCRRYPDGKLQSIIHNAEGMAMGVTVAWYPSGQIKLYCEMHSDVMHGLYIEWDKTGAKTVEQRFRRSKLIKG